MSTPVHAGRYRSRFEDANATPVGTSASARARDADVGDDEFVMSAVSQVLAWNKSNGRNIAILVFPIQPHSRPR